MASYFVFLHWYILIADIQYKLQFTAFLHIFDVLFYIASVEFSLNFLVLCFRLFSWYCRNILKDKPLFLLFSKFVIYIWDLGKFSDYSRNYSNIDLFKRQKSAENSIVR